MSTDSKNKIEEINNRFYEALNSFDIKIMEDIWLNDETVKCVHPGWPLISGWDAVKESWENIFDSSGFNHVSISKLFIDHKEDSAWVNCVERISYKFDNQIMCSHMCIRLFLRWKYM